MSTAESRSRALDPGPLITLYDLDLTPKGGPVLYFHDGIAQGDDQLVFAGHTYTPYPVRAEQFEWSTRGVLPRPQLTVSNIGSGVSALLRAYDDFVGCVITRTRTFEAFLTGHAEADPTQHFPIERFLVERKVLETNTICSFELSIHMDAEGVMLPRRQIIAHTCVWIYRGPDCGYDGVPKQNRDGTLFGTLAVDRGLYDPAFVYGQWDYTYTLVNGVRVYWVSKAPGNDRPLTNTAWWDMDVCLKKLSDCKLHFGATAILPTSAFPGAHKVL